MFKQFRFVHHRLKTSAIIFHLSCLGLFHGQQNGEIISVVFYPFFPLNFFFFFNSTEKKNCFGRKRPQNGDENNVATTIH